MSEPVGSGWFVTGVGTGIGKTFISRALTRALAASGRSVAAIKPLETGVASDPLDARALARACGRPELATAPGLYRVAPPLAPHAATLEGAAPPPDPGLLAHRVRELSSGADRLIVEGAGGLLVPLDARRTIADLARALALPLLIVAPDRLGVLSDVLTCVESATARGLTVAAVILSQHQHEPDDPSRRTNRRILQRRLPSPVLTFPSCLDDDRALADAARHCGLLAALELSSSAI